jgi:hypothetical protein
MKNPFRKKEATVTKDPGELVLNALNEMIARYEDQNETE